MHIVVTDFHNRLIACINTDGRENILVNGVKYFIAPQEENVAFSESKQGIFAYPQIVIKEE